MAKLTTEQRNLLEPWANLYARLEERIENMQPTERKALYDAALAATPTNCWCMIYRVSRLLQGALKDHFGQATMQEIKRADEAAKDI